MKKYISFIPWLLFSIIANGTFRSVLVASGLAIACYSWLIKSYSIKLRLLDICSLIFFAGAGMCSALKYNHFMMSNLFIIAYCFLGIACLLTILVKKPFTIAYAMEVTPNSAWETAEFYYINVFMSGTWVMYFFTSALVTKFSHLNHSALIAINIALVIVTIYLNKLAPATILKWFEK